ncbi:kinase-like domain-containing protein [Globomyces pollinis-pini]|nr:kinase-like domain-containing protein [Globomyces pollinis-pini]
MQKIKFNFKRPQPLQQVVDAAKTPFATFSKIVNCSTGNLNFEGKASLDKEGIKFENGTNYDVKLEDFTTLSMLGRGILNYFINHYQGQFGVVQKVVHKPTNVLMALKEIRLELDQNKLNHIIMELEVLHKSCHPQIIDFYGAFVLENCVYMSIEYMDGGSLDKLYKGGIPEPILAKITRSMLDGLSYLKATLNVIHRDVKPTNVLANTQGQIKICDFGVSGQLVQSMAKTNVGCQPYMAPERITHSSFAYSWRADIWSLGLSIVEMALGYYPFKEFQNDSVFAQLNAVVAGPAPTLPEAFTSDAQNFIALCLVKDPTIRPTYEMLLQSRWIKNNEDVEVDMIEWVANALQNN